MVRPPASAITAQTDRQIASAATGLPQVLPLVKARASSLGFGRADPDGQAIVTALVQGPSHGTLSLGLDGSFTYTPAANFNGIDTFMYQAVDSSGRQSNVAAVTITVNSVIDAVVDIKPGNDRNKINLRGKGSVPIAVLSTEASIGEIEDFDATKVRLDTIKLNGADITPAGYAFTDVDGDGDLDLLLQFSKVDFLTQGVLDSDSIDIVFTAELDGGGADGPDLIGSDSVNTKLPKPRGKSGK